MKALREKLDIVEAEKFISLILRENFDYTEWQRDLWNDKSVDEIFYAAKASDEKKKSLPQQKLKEGIRIVSSKRKRR